ncbi:hypothetical protein JCM6882_002555 [Rhodosporidiobolus microsporus]
MHRLPSSLRPALIPSLHLPRSLIPLTHHPRASMSSSAAAPAPLATVSSHETYLSSGIPSSSSLASSPLTQFSHWFAHAQSRPKDVPEPEAMSVSTVDPLSHIPSTRVVLLKQVDDRGFVFYTNYASRKGRELFPHGFDGEGDAVKGGYASAAFYWRALHLSVRVVGRAEKVDAQTTKAYFDSRPVGSRVGAWASEQSAVLASGTREELEDKVRQVERRFGVPEGTATGTASFVDVGPEGKAAPTEVKEVDIPVPPFWGGVRIVPFEVEFWAGRESRLHDRYRYTREEGDEEGEWKIERLSP